jgi:hypothetical protein
MPDPLTKGTTPMIRHRYAVVLLTLLLSAPLGRAADIDPYLPEDTESVLNVNVRQILDSDLIKKNVLELAQEALRGNDEVQDVLKDLGFDPFTDLERIIVAAPGGTDKDRGLVIVHGRFDVAKFKAKAEKVAKDDEDHLKIHRILGGKHLLYEVTVPERDESLYVALPSRDTLLVSPGKDYIIDALKKLGKEDKPAAKGKETRSSDSGKSAGVLPLDKPALKNKKFQELLEKLDTRQSVSLAVVKTPGLTKALEDAPGDIKAMLDAIQALGGGLTISDEVKLNLVATTKTAKKANELRESAKAGLDLVLAGLSAFAQANPTPELELAGDIIKTVRIKNNGSTVVITGRITSDVIEDAIKKKSK